MLDKDRLILIFYIDVSKIDSLDVNEYLLNIKDGISNMFDNSVIRLVLPIYSESRVECVNPKLIEKQEYDKILSQLKSEEEKFFEVLKNIKD